LGLTRASFDGSKEKFVLPVVSPLNEFAEEIESLAGTENDHIGL
jgi:hypothetical protein